MSAYFIDAVWSLKDHPLVADLRAYGMMAGLNCIMMAFRVGVAHR